MAAEYSVETIEALGREFDRAEVVRPRRVGRHEAGQVLNYNVRGVSPAREAHVRLKVERFVGGGFAGQVYRVRAEKVDSPSGPISGLDEGGVYALKILVPPSAQAKRFRDAIYAVGFQAPFSLQSNPDAARAGALWQKLIRRGAKIRFSDERAVVNPLATLIDPALGSCGEISEWVDGRTWGFEVDDHLLTRWRWKPGRALRPCSGQALRPCSGQDGEHLGSPEYRAKRVFMREVVSLLHDMGARELARQYEWWTCKSQPNCLKRLDADDDPAAGPLKEETTEARRTLSDAGSLCELSASVVGLTAVDFRAGLALLPFLPMSPGDVKLIFAGLLRGSLVQFDRGNLRKLRRFIEANADEFADLGDVFDELVEAERRYRNSIPDVTHNHVRLLYSPHLWKGICDGAVESWRIRNITDEAATGVLRRSRLMTLAFAVLGLLPLLSLLGGIALFAGGLAMGYPWAPVTLLALALVLPVRIAFRLARKLLGRGDYRWHYGKCLASFGYLRRAFRAHIAETLISWHRAGRVSADRATKLYADFGQFFLHAPLSVLPAGLHRFCTDRLRFKQTLWYIFIRPVRLLFNAEAREQWLLDMLAEGRRNGMLSDADYEEIRSRVKDPFIQKYLTSLAVHVCTLPITQVVSAIVAIWYWASHPDLTFWQGFSRAGAILVAFQVIPVSPGSFVRGMYVLYLVIRERNFRDYNIAVFLGFFKYIGYLAFPIQMAHHYPALARFMAGHWATGAVHFVPVFGEKGALLEHSVFDLFYNYPLTVRRRQRLRAEARERKPKRRWHVPAIALAAGGVLAGIDYLHIRSGAPTPLIGRVWYAAVLVPLLAGVVAALGAGGATMSRRVVFALVTGLGVGVLYAASNTLMARFLAPNADILGDGVVKYALIVLLWRVFLFAILATVGGLVAEANAPVPRGSLRAEPSPAT